MEPDRKQTPQTTASSQGHPHRKKAIPGDEALCHHANAQKLKQRENGRRRQQQAVVSVGHVALLKGFRSDQRKSDYEKGPVAHQFAFRPKRLLTVGRSGAI